MNENGPGAGRRRSHWQTVASEAAAVACLGVVLALLANALSPRGLVLTRNYFPRAAETSARPLAHPATTAPAPPRSGGPLDKTADETAARLTSLGVSVIHLDQVRALVDDPKRQQELIVFVDAREEPQYREGHLPGAWQMDRFRPELYLPALLPVCLAAEKVVVYCNGRDCDDSEFAARLLKEAGVPGERLWVFTGGMSEWKEQGLPLEAGDRNSGDVRKAAP